MVMELITRIKSIYPSLTKSEQKVGNYFLNNMKSLAFISVTDLAEKCSVGEATIFRFSKKIGYSGFHEFKRELIGMQEGKRESTNNIDKELEQTFSEMEIMLEHTMKLTDSQALTKVANFIKQCDNLYFFGLGLSNLSAKAAEIRFSALGYKAFAFDDQHMQLIKANSAAFKDVVIGLSVSGATTETVKKLIIARENGAKVIAITNHTPSPISNVSDVTLLTASKHVLAEGTSLTTQTSQLFVLEQLSNKLIQIDKERITSARKKIIASYD